ncbi:MAG TPA: Dam family site-specific DNA-(adenine-N6)-methyltransferase [Pyrinomonadaceae bacterium]|nr:Dam family site-specific DNA-(adenine-N6)-methyltransferase [Pyrinomonadaceae bacterium]
MKPASSLTKDKQPFLLPVSKESLEPGYTLPPPLKWAGGKRWQLPFIKNYWQGESHRRLVEPFCGGLAVTLGLMPKFALLNDINPHLMNFYRWLKRGLNLSIEMSNNEQRFYRYRTRFNELLLNGKESSKEAASIFYYLNRTGYNGLCRFNKSGEFNVPFGSYKRINYRRDFRAYKRLISDWHFTNTGFLKVPLQADDFVYADPPYDVEFTQYSKDGFAWDDQVKTAEWLARHSGPVVLSNQATKRIVDLYRDLGFQLLYLKAPRRISCTGDRTPATELLALRNLS